MTKSKIPERTPIYVFLLGVALTVLAGTYSQDALEDRDNLRLTKLASDIDTRISSLVNVITYGLGGANGVFAASKSVERDEFRSYVDSRDLPVEFPGVLGFGFAQYVDRANLEKFVNQAKADGQPTFSVRTSGERSNLFITRFLEPAEVNQAAIGFDIGSEPHRREAAETAMVTGRPTLTRRVQLLQDSNGETGFLYLRPVFRRGAPVRTPEERRTAIEGWVFAPFTLERVLKPVVDRYDDVASLQVFEGDGQSPETLLFSNATSDPVSPLERVARIELGQQVWTVVVHPRLAFFSQDDSRYLPTGVFIIGLLMSLVTARGLWYFLEAKNRAMSSQLRAGERFIQGVVDSANFSIIVTEPNGVIRVFNRTAARWLGYEPSEVIGKQTPAILHDPEEVSARAKEVSAKLGRTIEPGFEVFVAQSRENIADEKEWSYIRKDGSRFPVNLSVTAMRNEENQIIAFMGIADDNSERKQSERELLQSEERFRSSFDYASHGIALVGIDGRWLRVNRALCQMLGYREEELLKRTFQDITHPEDLDADLALVQQVLEGDIENYDMEKRYFDSSGDIVWVLLSVSLVRDEHGAPLYFVSQIQDITDQKQAAFQLKEKAAELELAKHAAIEAARSKSQFLANMSHEIRTPLTSIIGYSESLMEDSLSSEEQGLALETIMKNGKHLLGVISDILDISKIEAGKLDVEIVSVELAELISDVGNLMQHRAQEKGLSLGFEYLFPIPRRIQTDPTRLKQILINLVGNAVKFTSVGGVKIHVRYLRKDERLEFAVIDTGPGLTGEQREKLFKAFSQADTSITRKFGGTGLGLLISSQLAQRLGGDITLQSEPGKGSVFTVSIATGKVDEDDLVSSIETRIHEHASPETVQVPHLKGRVLVAEDGEDNRGLISFLLGKVGVEFTVVENGALAVAELAKEHFDLVLMDVQMPVMDGYSATKKIRAQGSNVPIVALTANAMKADVEKALSVGCSDFLGKPFTRSDLFAKLARFLPSSGVPEGASDHARPSGVQASERTITMLREDPELLPLLLSVLRKLPTRVDEIQNAATSGDMARVSMLAHSLRGSSGQLGLVEVSDSAGIVERAAEEGSLPELEKGMASLRAQIDATQRLEDVFRAEVP